MARTFGFFRLAVSLAVVVVGVVGLGSPVGASPPPPSGAPVGASPPPASGAPVGTPLPTGWEDCVLQGVGASVTEDDIANLDEWQVVEGGSTDNSAAYNPFNTRQVTDSTGVPIPAVVSSGGFPAFATWAAGCAATVATLLQPSMAPIVTALKAGDVAAPGLFLSDVDRSPWCAPSADGIPCYASEILAGELVEALLNGSSGQLQDALTSFSDTGADLHSYEADASVAVADQGLLAARNEQLTVAQNAVSAARRTLAEATGALRQVAIDDYTGDAGVRSDANLQLFGPSDDQGVIARDLGDLADSLLVVRYQQTQAAFTTSVSKREAAQSSLTQATSLLDSAATSENQDLSKLEADAKSIEAGLACTAPPLVTATALSVGGPPSAGQLWAALQDCLAPPPEVVAPTTASASS